MELVMKAYDISSEEKKNEFERELQILEEIKQREVDHAVKIYDFGRAYVGMEVIRYLEKDFYNEILQYNFIVVPKYQYGTVLDLIKASWTKKKPFSVRA